MRTTFEDEPWFDLVDNQLGVYPTNVQVRSLNLWAQKMFRQREIETCSTIGSHEISWTLFEVERILVVAELADWRQRAAKVECLEN